MAPDKRDIKFRGKRLDNNEWGYGSLIKTDDGVFIFDGCGFCKNETRSFHAYMHEIDPETISEKTNLYDENGQAIYEGDKVSLHGSKWQIVYEAGQFIAVSVHDPYNISDKANLIYCQKSMCLETPYAGTT